LKFLDFILSIDERNMLWMKGGDIKIKYDNSGRKVENEI
jgi:hypothetical protein